MMDINPNGIYTVKDLSGGLDVSEGTVYNYINRDGLKGTRIRGKTYIKGSDLLGFLFKESGKTNLYVIRPNQGEIAVAGAS